MVVYHIGHFGALSKALMIHLTLHRKGKCSFLIDTTLCNHESREFLSGFASRAAEFASVVVYSDREFIDETGLDSIKKHVNSYFSELLRKNGIDLKKAEKIYTMFDTFNAFGAFALMNNIPLVFVDVFGVMAKDRYRPRGPQWTFYDELLKEVGALGYGCKNKNCVFLYRDNAAAPIGEGKINFEALRLGLDSGAIEILLKLYGFDPVEGGELCNLLVFSSGWIMANKKIDKQKYFYYYQLALDFFAQSGHRLLLKPHPNMEISEEEAKKYFGDALVIPGYFPSEFIPFLKGVQVEQVIATSLSGVPTGIYGCKYFTAFEIFSEEKIFKRLYFALQVEKFLQPQYKKFYHQGLHNRFAWGMQDGIFSKYRLHSVWSPLQCFEADSITIIDNYLWNGPADKEKLIAALKGIDNNAVVIFLDARDKGNYLFKEYEEGAAYIKTLYFAQEPFGPCAEKCVEKLHVFCKDLRVFKQLNNFQYREYMPYSKNLYYSF